MFSLLYAFGGPRLRYLETEALCLCVQPHWGQPVEDQVSIRVRYFRVTTALLRLLLSHLIWTENLASVGSLSSHDVPQTASKCNMMSPHDEPLTALKMKKFC